MEFPVANNTNEKLVKNLGVKASIYKILDKVYIKIFLRNTFSGVIE